VKRRLSTICCLVFLLAFVMSLAACNEVYYERSECTKHINEFLDGVFARDTEKLSQTAYMDEVLYSSLNRYKDDAFISKVMEKASYDVYIDNVRQTNKKIYFDCFLVTPDYTTAYRSAPSFGDLDYFSRAIDGQGKNEYKKSEVTVNYVVSNGVWIVENLNEVVSILYDPMYEVLTEGRSKAPMSFGRDLTDEDWNAFYHPTIITDVNFEMATMKARNSDSAIVKYTDGDLSKFGLEGCNADYVLDSEKGTSKITFTLYHFQTREDAEQYFASHCHPDDRIEYYYRSKAWGYSRDLNYDGIDLLYWDEKSIVYAAAPGETRKADGSYPDEYTLFLTGIGILG